MSNKALIFDTTTPENAALILSENGTPVHEVIFSSGQSLSGLLLPKVKEILEKEHLTVKDLSYVATATGPGSFTGIRVGASIAKALSFAQNIPLIGFSSFLGYATPKQKNFALILDAKIAGIYYSLCENTNENLIIHPSKAVSLQETKKIFEDIPYLYSPDAETLKMKLETFVPSEKIAKTDYCTKSLSKECEKIFLSGKITEQRDLELHYLSSLNTIS